MDPDDILSALESPANNFPEAALRAAEEQGDRIAGALVDLIERAGQRAAQDLPVPGGGHIFALLLLARLGYERAYSVVASFLALPAQILDGLLGDFLTEDLGRVLASLSGGRIDDLATLIEDRTRAPYVRVAAMSGIAALVARGVVERAQAADYLRSLVRNGLLHDSSEEVASQLGSIVLDLYVDDLFDDVREAIRSGSVPAFALRLSDVASAERAGCEVARTRLARDRHLFPVRDLVAETHWWACWSESEDGDSEERGFETCGDPDCHEHHGSNAPIVRDRPKIGRNDSCPCGSGRKHKKCCLGAETPG